MKIKDLKLFIKVVELGSFTAAANALDLPRANVSRRISDLESLLNIKLFQRSTRQVSLTQNGLAYYQEILLAVQALDKAHSVGLSLSDSPKGKIRIGLQPETDLTLQDSLFAFQDMYPEIELDVRHISNGLADINQLNLDLVLHAGAIDNSNFIARKIISFEKCLTASPQFITDNPNIRSKNDLTNVECICYRWPNGEIDNNWLIGTKRINVQSKLCSNNIAFVKQAVLKHRGVGFLPSLIIEEELSSGELIRLLPTYKAQKESIYLLYPKRNTLTHAAKLLIDYLQLEIPKLLKLS